MAAKSESHRLRRAVGIFHEGGRLQSALHELIQVGVSAPDLSLLARQHLIETKLGHGSKAEPLTLAYLLDDLIKINADGPSGPLLCSVGKFAAFLNRLAVKDDVEAKPLLARWLLERQAAFLRQQLDGGAILLRVDLHDDTTEQRVSRLLLQHSEHQVQLHDEPVRRPEPCNPATSF